MSTTKISSPVLILAVAIAALVYTSPTLITPALAQTTTTSEDTTGGANTDTAQQDYQDFQQCLTEAEGGDDFATEDEIRECFQPIYIGGESAEDENEDDEGNEDEEDDNDTNN
jgi:hypothetical protein